MIRLGLNELGYSIQSIYNFGGFTPTLDALIMELDDRIDHDRGHELSRISQLHLSVRTFPSVKRDSAFPCWGGGSIV